MKIDTNLIEGYAEMSAEDKLKALEAFEYDDFSADRDRYKKSNSDALSKVAELTKQLRATKTDEENAKADREALDKANAEKIASLEKELSVTKNEKKFIGMGYSEKLANEIAVAMADGDNEKVFECMATFNAEQDKKIRAEIAKKAPKIDDNGGDGKDDADISFAKRLGQNKAKSASNAKDALSKYIK